MKYEEFQKINNMKKKAQVSKLRITDEVVKVNATTVNLSNGTKCEIKTLIQSIVDGKGCLSNPSKLQNWNWSLMDNKKDDYLDLKDLTTIGAVEDEVNQIVNYFVRQLKICREAYEQMRKDFQYSNISKKYSDYTSLSMYGTEVHDARKLLNKEWILTIPRPHILNSFEQEWYNKHTIKATDNYINTIACMDLCGKVAVCYVDNDKAEFLHFKDVVDCYFQDRNKQQLIQFIKEYRLGKYQNIFEQIQEECKTAFNRAKEDAQISETERRNKEWKV